MSRDRAGQSWPDRAEALAIAFMRVSRVALPSLTCYLRVDRQLGLVNLQRNAFKLNTSVP